MSNNSHEKHINEVKVTSKCLQETIFKKLKKVHIANLKSFEKSFRKLDIVWSKLKPIP